MYCCENAQVKIKERIKLYEQCISETLKEQLSNRISEEELAYIELLIYHKYTTGLECDVYA
jgi:hypothetical protein